jgi:hypothetical protein
MTERKKLTPEEKAARRKEREQVAKDEALRMPSATLSHRSGDRERWTEIVIQQGLSAIEVHWWQDGQWTHRHIYIGDNPAALAEFIHALTCRLNQQIAEINGHTAATSALLEVQAEAVKEAKG